MARERRGSRPAVNQDGASQAGRGIVIVPRRPGPLADLPAPEPRQRDDLDELLDDLFGEPTREGPGLFDIALIAAGTALALAAGLAHLASALAVTGGALIALGLVLPVRDLWRRAARRRAGRRLDAALGQGLALDTRDPATGQLAAAYRHVTSLCEHAGGMGADAREAAHLAVVEVAGVLQGRPPQGAAEQEYALARVRALQELAHALSASPAAPVGRAEADESAARDAGLAAIVRMEERTGASSLARIDVLRRALTGSGP
jgi:hypothetical protein